MPRLSIVGAASSRSFGFAGKSAYLITYVVIGAGGGSGGYAGGGGGQIITNSALTIPYLPQTVTIGSGISNGDGQSTVFGSITALGGKGGGLAAYNYGGNSGNGHIGGYSFGSGNYLSGGGGGGDSQDGGGGQYAAGGYGGNGTLISTIITPTYFSGGGGGIAVGDNNLQNQAPGGLGGTNAYYYGPANGAANTGAGAGGTGGYGSQGGSGLVVLRYAGSQQGTGGTITTTGGYTYHYFYSNGIFIP